MTTALRIALAAALTLATTPLAAQNAITASLAPMLHADVTVTSDVVRIGDFVDNAGDKANIAIFRAPDPGTMGSVPTASIVEALRAHEVIGVDTHNLSSVTVTRLGRTISAKDIEQRIAKAIARHGGLGEAEDLTLRLDNDIQAINLPADSRAELMLLRATYNAQSARFDAVFALKADDGTVTRLRYAGSAAELVEATVLTRSLERGAIISANDIITEKRPKADVAADRVAMSRAPGMSLKRALRAGQVLQEIDLARPELVQRNENVTIIYETAGIYLTIRGKAMESGSQGDVITVTNLQSKRTVQATITGPNQVSVSPIQRRIARAEIPAQDQPAAETRKAE